MRCLEVKIRDVYRSVSPVKQGLLELAEQRTQPAVVATAVVKSVGEARPAWVRDSTASRQNPNPNLQSLLMNILMNILLGADEERNWIFLVLEQIVRPGQPQQ